MVVTFTTPSIEIAGRELNPIAELAVGDVADEFTSIIFPFSQDGHVGDLEAGSLVTDSVDAATGRKVLGAFRDAVGGNGSGGGGELLIDRDDIIIETGQPIPEGEEVAGPTPGGNHPRWNGDRYRVTIQDSNAGERSMGLRFDKHDGDFVVIFETRTVSGTAGDVMRLPITTEGNDSGFQHPADDAFTEEMLLGHVIETNLQCMQGLVDQVRKLIDETQNLLTQAENDTRDEEDERFAAITATQDDLQQLDTLMGGLGDDLVSLRTKTVTTDENGDWSVIVERAQSATEIATRAHERVASHNDTRNEEDDRFVQIERKLGGLLGVSRTVRRTLANGRKTVKARDV